MLLILLLVGACYFEINGTLHVERARKRVKPSSLCSILQCPTLNLFEKRVVTHPDTAPECHRNEKSL